MGMSNTSFNTFYNLWQVFMDMTGTPKFIFFDIARDT
jgi:hypothetical protein